MLSMLKILAHIKAWTMQTQSTANQLTHLKDLEQEAKRLQIAKIKALKIRKKLKF